MAEKNLAGVSVNSTGIGVMPAGSDMWSFKTDAVLTAGEELPVTVEAWDSAGNRAVLEIILKLAVSAVIEMISPLDGAEYTASGTETEIMLTARVSGAPEGADTEAAADGGIPQQIPLSAGIANGTFVSPAEDGDHVLTLRILDSEGTVIAQTSVHYTVTNTDSIPLRVENLDPADNAKNAEPDSVIRFYFNRPAEKISDFEVTVKETAHGIVYDTGETEGNGLAGMSRVSLAEMHRDMETVPGRLALLSGELAAEFYPDSDYAYGSTVYAGLKYKNSDVSRSLFAVRDLPTFVTGAVTDRFGSIISGMEISLPEPGRTAVTGSDGGFSFGFGEPAEKMLPPGIYSLVINPNMKNQAFGTLTFRINVEQGRLNRAGIFSIPTLSPEEPFRRIGTGSSGSGTAVLAGGKLRLDLTEAVLTFPDGRSSGNVHVMSERIDEIPFEAVPGAIPHWMFAIQPFGTEVRGRAEADLAMPALYGSYEYIPGHGTPVILAGFGAVPRKIVPAGAGLVECADKNNKGSCRVKGRADFTRLDYIGYALVQPEQQPLLEQYLEGEISLKVLTGKLMQGKTE
ncbi:MAG: carboxypeptidase regulatory-like domain-containing protein [Gammaproteobacteria bacterium]|nr:carboxypeptidase regulatory-like domain-containing protein [Gammaproteobacteria bacterium]